MMNAYFDHMAHNWPPFRTNLHARSNDIWRASLFGAIGSCVAPFVIGVLLLGLSAPLKTETTSDIYETLWAMGFVLTVSPAISLFAAIPAIMLFVIALKNGIAGWVVATTAGATLSTIIFAFVISIQGNPVVFGGIIGGCFGALFWLCARLSTPNVIIRSADSM